MNVYGLQIDPDGRCTTITTPGVRHTAEPIIGRDTTSVVTLTHPILAGETYIGWIDDWGRVKGLPLNIKAWALYGRSPIVGTIVIARDVDDHGRREPIPETVLAVVTASDWPGEELRAQMRVVLDALDDGHPVPLWNGPS